MSQEAYCSFEVARLLKENGFDWDCITYYVDSEPNDVKYSMLFENNTTWEERCCSAPTHQIAMKWLMEKYNIYISIQPDFPSDKNYKMCWCWSANMLHENCISMKGFQCYIETYKDAVEAALKYSLENLI